MRGHETVTGVLAIQRCMAQASPHSWRDGIVVAADEDAIELALLDGGVLRLSATGVGVAVGEPVAYHPVAEILAVAGASLTARVAR